MWNEWGWLQLRGRLCGDCKAAEGVKIEKIEGILEREWDVGSRSREGGRGERVDEQSLS